MTLDNLRPFYASNHPNYEEELKPDSVKVVTRFGASYIRPLFVIVETYDHKSYGRGKREYLKQFTEAERKVISKWYGRLYDCYLRRGIPFSGVEMAPGTLALLQRAANFFASI